MALRGRTRMRRRSAIVLIVGVLLMVGVVGGAGAAPPPKVDLCHVAQGSGNLIPITVSETALEAHLAHGDLLVGDGITADCEAIPAPDVTVRGEMVNEVGQTVADGDGLHFDYLGDQWTDPTRVYPEEYWGTYKLYLPGAFVSALVWVDFAGPQEEMYLSLTSEVLKLATDGSRTPVAGTFSQEAFWLGIGEEWQPPAGGYEWLLANEAKGLLVVEFKLYDGDPADDQLLYHLELVFCPPEV